MKKQGVLIYDDVIDRMDIRFGPLDYYGAFTAESGWRCCLTESGSRRESNSVSSGISRALS